MEHDYIVLHNSVLSLYHDILNGKVRDMGTVQDKLRTMVETSAGITFAEAQQLFHVSEDVFEAIEGD